MSQKGEQTQRFQPDLPASHDHHMQAHARLVLVLYRKREERGASMSMVCWLAFDTAT